MTALTTLEEYNVKLTRTAKGILEDDNENDDEVKATLVKAKANLDDIEARLRIRKKFRAALFNLVYGPSGPDTKFINHFFSKIPALLRFVFIEQGYESKRLRLRQLNPHALIFCALSHTVYEIKTSSEPCFKILIESLDVYFRSRNITHFLYVPIVEKYVSAPLETDVDDIEAVYDFKRAYADLQPEYLPLGSPTCSTSSSPQMRELGRENRRDSVQEVREAIFSRPRRRQSLPYDPVRDLF